MPVWIVCLSIRIYEGIDKHSGYALPWTPWALFPSFLSSTAMHDFHHTSFLGPYGSYFKFWDWVVGTTGAFEKNCAEKLSTRATTENRDCNEFNKIE